MSEVTSEQDVWSRSEAFFDGLLTPTDPALEAALRSSSEAALPSINVTPSLGHLLQLLVRSVGARSVLEIGTLGGYSTIWLARALPAGGRLVTLELEQRHADVARANLERAGVASAVEIIVGPAVQTLPRLRERGEVFDFVFIDADKVGYSDYLKLALEVSRPGTLLVADNVVRGGTVAEADGQDETSAGIRRFLDAVTGEKRISATVVQTVGSKGYDGFLVGLVGS